MCIQAALLLTLTHTTCTSSIHIADHSDTGVVSPPVPTSLGEGPDPLSSGWSAA